MDRRAGTIVKLLKKMQIWEYLKQHDGKKTFSDMAKEMKIKNNYAYELMNFCGASGLVEFDKKNQIIMSTRLRDLHNVNDLRVIVEFEQMFDIFEKCITGTIPGYKLDEYQLVSKHIQDSRIPFEDKIASELAGFIKKYYFGKKEPKHVLDAGCGNGALTMWLQYFLGGNVKVDGWDDSKKAIAECEANNTFKDTLSFQLFNLGKMPKENYAGKYDVVVLFDVLHDLTNPDAVMETLHYVLKDDGLLIVVDPKVSSNMLNNLNNAHAAIALFYSLLYCIPTACCSNAHGVGWGDEKKKIYLESKGLEIIGYESILGIPLNYAYFLKKTKKGLILK